MDNITNISNVLTSSDIESDGFIHSEDVSKIFLALSKAQGDIINPKKSIVNPFFKSKYADLSVIIDACRLPLSVNEIACMQAPYTPKDGTVGVETLFGHSSGQFIKFRFKIKPNKFDIQSVGSIITYIKRFSLSSALLIVGDNDDDDGNAGMTPPTKPPILSPRIDLTKVTKEQSVELTNLIKDKDIPRDRLLVISSSICDRQIDNSNQLNKIEMTEVINYIRDKYNEETYNKNKEEN